METPKLANDVPRLNQADRGLNNVRACGPGCPVCECPRRLIDVGHGTDCCGMHVRGQQAEGRVQRTGVVEDTQLLEVFDLRDERIRACEFRWGGDVESGD